MATTCAIRQLAKLFLQVTLSEIRFRVVVPKTLHEKNALRAFGYVLRDVLCTVVVYKLDGCLILSLALWSRILDSPSCWNSR